MNICRTTRRTALLLALIMLVLSFGSGALAADGLNAAYYKLVLVKRGAVTGEVKVNVREEADADSDRLGRLEPGESVVVTGEDGDWYQVEFEGEIGYIRKDLITVTESEEEVEVVVEDPLEASLAELSLPSIIQYRNEVELEGIITSNIPLTAVTVEVYNERTFEIDRSETETFKRDDNVLEYDLNDLGISFHKIDPGEKQLIIRVQSTNESMILTEKSFYVYTRSDHPFTDASSMTDDCKLDVDGDEDDLTDNVYTTSVELEDAESRLTITLPEGRNAEGIALHWATAPSNVSITFLGADDAELSSIEQSNESNMIHFYHNVDAAARKIVVSTADEGKALCEVRVYEQERVSKVVQQWQELPEKLDMLVISAHQDDEMLFFGGTIPYYSAQGKKVGVVYMANCGRRRYAEALDGLWSSGLTYHPVFIGFQDRKTDYEESVELWGMENTENALVALIRQYQPEVIVTHDVDGEYGHNQHKVTCAAVQSAVTKAGDPMIDPATAEKYGLWTPKKLYIHLYEENEIFMEVYDEPVEELDGMTMTDMATIGYSKHVSQQSDFSMEVDGVKYDNRKYGLAFTTVGQDVEKKDFFENIN